MTYEWHDFAGNVGVALILSGYLLLQLDRLSSKSKGFSLLNAAGAALVLTSLMFKFNLSAFVVEFFWLAISIGGMMRRSAVERQRPARSGRGELGS